MVEFVATYRTLSVGLKTRSNKGVNLHVVILSMPHQPPLILSAVLFICKTSDSPKQISWSESYFPFSGKRKWKRMVPHEAIELKYFCKVSLVLSPPQHLTPRYIEGKLTRGGWIFESTRNSQEYISLPLQPKSFAAGWKTKKKYILHPLV